ncbi:MAG TPA: CAP domain-containing protein [Alphaproteobacteria bacterium]|nr:CAP domain-containing protein [Alphaproteobacteria bacterium]
MKIAKSSVLFAILMSLSAVPATAVGPAADPAAAANLLALVNRARSDAGLAPVHPNAELTAVAQSMADDLARRGVLSHVDSNGAGIDARFLQAGYRYSIAVEVVAAPHADPQEVIADWMANPSNREQILTDDLNDAGVGYATTATNNSSGPASGFWVLDMGSPIVVHF